MERQVLEVSKALSFVSFLLCLSLRLVSLLPLGLGRTGQGIGDAAVREACCPTACWAPSTAHCCPVRSLFCAAPADLLGVPAPPCSASRCSGASWSVGMCQRRAPPPWQMSTPACCCRCEEWERLALTAGGDVLLAAAQMGLAPQLAAHPLQLPSARCNFYCCWSLSPLQIYEAVK